MSFLSDVFTGGAGTVIESVGKVADALFTSDDERNRAAIEMERIGLEREMAYLADTDSARNMQVAALQQDDIFSKRFVYYFVIAWSVFSMTYFGFVTFVGVAEGSQRVADTILGVLIGTVVTGMFQFFLGSTSRSHSKDATIKALSEK